MEKDIRTVMRERVVPEGAARYGLVVGIDKYANEALNLQCATADAQTMYDLMVDPDCGMFEPDKVKLLLDGDATKINVEKALYDLGNRSTEADTVWIYYSGHGAPDPETNATCWITHDTDLTCIQVSAVPNSTIEGLMGRIKAGRMVTFLDCCHASDVVRQATGTKAVITDPKDLFQQFTGTGRFTVCSSRGEEKSVELPDRGHGAFTFFLTQGLRGAADANGDGVVGAMELWSYLERKVAEAAREVGKDQTPQLIAECGHALGLTLNPEAAAQKQRWAQAIRENIGLPGEGKLTSREAEFALDVLRRGPENDDESEMAVEFESLANGTLRVTTFRVLVKVAMGAREDDPGQDGTKPPAPPQKKWFYLESGMQQGPVEEEELHSLIMSFKITRSHMVWNPSMAAWAQATTVAELLVLFEQVPPPPPPKDDGDGGGTKVIDEKPEGEGHPPTPTKVELVVTSSPEGAQVFLVDDFIGTTPLRHDKVEPGQTYEVSVDKPPKWSAPAKEITVGESGETVVFFEMVRKGKGPTIVEPGRSELALEKLSGDTAACYGDWVVARRDDHYIVLAHPEEEVAIELWDESNGWFRLAREGKELCVLSSGQTDSDQLHTDYVDLFSLEPSCTLKSGACTIGSYDIQVAGEEITLVCTENDDTITVSPDAARFLFNGREVGESPEPSGATVALDDIAVGDGAVFGDWHVWRPTDTYILVTHPAGRVAAEMWIESNGWFRCAMAGQQHVVWSTGSSEPQNMNSDFESYFGRTPSQELDRAECKLENYEVKFSGDDLQLINVTDRETLTLSPHSSSVVFSGKELRLTPSSPVGGGGDEVSVADLSPGEGAAFGEWVVWRATDRYLLVTHAEARVAMEMWIESNGWFRCAADGKQHVVWSSGSSEDQDLNSDFGDFFGRTPEYTLAQKDCEVKNYKIGFSGGGLELVCKDDGETIRVSPDSWRFTFNGKVLAMLGEGGGEPPKSGGTVVINAMALDDGASWGEWGVWHPKEGYLLLTHPGDEVAIEICLDSNGWFRCAAHGDEHVVWSAGSSDPQKIYSEYRTYYGRSASDTLDTGSCSMQNFDFRVSMSELQIICKDGREVISVSPNSSRFTFNGEVLAMLEGGASPSGGSGTSGTVTLEDMEVGAGAVFGDWCLWREGEYIVATHAGDSIAIEMWTSSNGWFRCAAGGKQHVVWSTGKSEDQALNSKFQALFQRTPDDSLAEESCKVGTYDVQFSGGKLELINRDDRETISIDPDSSSYTFNGKVIDMVRDARGGSSSGRTRRRSSGGASASRGSGTALKDVPAHKGASYGEWNVWRSDDSHLVVQHPGDDVTIEIWIESNGWFNYAIRGEQWTMWSTGSSDKESLDTEFAGYNDRKPEHTLGLVECVMENYTIRATSDKLEFCNKLDSGTLTIYPGQSSFEFNGKSVDTGGGRAKSPQTRSGAKKVALKRVSVGQGVGFGDWNLWRTDDDHLLLTHSGDEVAIEIWLESSGWFNFSGKGEGKCCWSSGETSKEVLDSDLSSYFGRSTTDALDTKGCTIQNYDIKFSGDDLQIICRKDKETITISPHSSQFGFRTFQGKDKRFP